MFELQNPNNPSAIYFSFDEAIREDLLAINWAVAYATQKGCEALINKTQNIIGEEAWQNCQKEFVVSIDFGHTEPAAIEMLMGLSNSIVRLQNTHLLEKGHLRPSSAFHPKIYAFLYPDRACLMQGSANLTNAALHKNTEAIQIHWSANLEEVGNLWSRVVKDSAEANDEILDGYRALRRSQRVFARPGPTIDTPPAPEAIEIDTVDDAGLIEAETSLMIDDANEYPWMFGAINQAAPTLNPAEFSHFWVEAGSMPSSASHNQLELGRGSNLFFGYNYRAFEQDDHVVTLGQLRFRIHGRMFEDAGRKYKWHPNNMMERVNLPTPAQADVTYRNKCLLFKRRDGFYDITVAEWDSEEAIAWRKASDTKGLRYRIPQQIRANTHTRVCGFF